MTKPKPKKEYATLKFRDKNQNGRLVAIDENVTVYMLMTAGKTFDKIVLVEFVEGRDKGLVVAVRLSNLTRCKL